MITRQRFTLCYLLLSLVILFHAYLPIPNLYFFSKSLIMISLFVWVMTGRASRKTKGKPIFLVGMGFALLGDILLMLNGYFLQGLAAFLVMQWCYIIAFKRDLSKLASAKFALACIVGIGIVIVTLLIPLTNAITDTILQGAIIVYGVSIGLMLWLATLRLESSTTLSYRFVVVGALLFAVSDSLIAWNKFVEPIPMSHFAIMSTYLLAQYLITRGFLKTHA